MRTTQGTWRSAIAGLAVLLVCTLLAGCIKVPLGTFGTTGEPPPTKTNTKSSPTKPAPISPAMVGRWLTAGSWKVLVARAVTSSKGPGGVKAAAGKSFLLIEVEFKNVGMSEALLVNPKYVTLKSASGKQVAMYGTASGYNARGMREIGPGYGGITVFVYQIPKGSAGYTFTVSPKVAGKRAKLQWGVP